MLIIVNSYIQKILWLNAVPEKHPPGVGSLFISDETCKKFNIEKKIDTENNIHFKADTKMVKEDIKNLGAESNFFPLKDMLMVISSLWNIKMNYLSNEIILNIVFKNTIEILIQVVIFIYQQLV